MDAVLKGRHLAKSALVLAVLAMVLGAFNVTPSRPVLADVGDNYPWKTAPYPGPPNPSDTWGYAERYCTSWVAWALHDRNGFEMPHAIGDAYKWASAASSLGYTVNSTPAYWAVAQWNGHSWNGGYGHVAWVSTVNGDGSIVVEEYNYTYPGAYDSRTIKTDSRVWPDNFIHFKDLKNKVVGDFDGSGKTEYTVFRPSNGTWYYYYNAYAIVQQFGESGDIPVPGHYSGGTKADYAVFRPSNSTWYILPQGGSAYAVAFGQSGDIPMPAYWGGGNKTEPGVFRPSNGTWYYLTPTGSVSQQFGLNRDIPVPGYYSGSSKPDYAIFRPSNVNWYVKPQSGSAYQQSFGSTGDIPAIQTLPLPILQKFGLL